MAEDARRRRFWLFGSGEAPRDKSRRSD